MNGTMDFQMQSWSLPVRFNPFSMYANIYLSKTVEFMRQKILGRGGSMRGNHLVVNHLVVNHPVAPPPWGEFLERKERKRKRRLRSEKAKRKPKKVWFIARFWVPRECNSQKIKTAHFNGSSLREARHYV